MTRPFTPKVITANALIAGDVVWFTATNQWSRDIAEAELIKDETRAADQLSAAEAQANLIVGPYLADAKQGENGPEPTHFREAFRTRGPSNYAHGKQVEA